MPVGDLFLYLTPDFQAGKLYWKPRGIPRFDSRYAGTVALDTERHGYKAGSLQGKKYLAHRVLWAMYYGEWPDKIDHKDRVRSNNTLDNLREATQQENMFNRPPSVSKSSAYKGVAFHKHTKKWRAYITKDNKATYLGYFHSELDAAKAYNNRAKDLFGEFAYLNAV